MVNDALLGKLRGNRHTFGVYSNATPYAAAAAMGSAMGRSEQSGPYLNLLQQPKPCGLTQTEAVATGQVTLDGVNTNFKADWAQFLRHTGLVACGLKYDESKTAQENTMRYLNAHDRRIPIMAPRTVHESRELSIPPEYQLDYVALKQAVNAGADLKPYLSRDILKKKRPDKNDGLLNSWGMQHLHFRPGGTAHILLCKITETAVFLVQALPHVDDVWVDTSLLQILHDNWPEELTECHGLNSEVLSSTERMALRNYNANFPTTMTDGTGYLAPGGGVMASGDCVDDHINCAKIFAQLAHWEGIVRSNASHLRLALNWPEHKSLSVRIAFDGRDCWLYEPTTRTAISLTIN